MAFSDSMFLFEFIVEELKSYIHCTEFYITSQFADVFTLNLKDPNELGTLVPKRKVKKQKKKTKVRYAKTPPQKELAEGKVQTGQSILFTSRVETLISKMKAFPIELSLWDKDHPKYKLGSTHIPWSPVYIDYLYNLFVKPDVASAYVIGGYNVFDEFTSKRMATIRLNIKITYLKDKITSSFRSLSEDNQNTFMYTGLDSKPTTILSTIKDAPVNLMEETGLIKTIYNSGKKKLKSSKSKTYKKKHKKLTQIGNNNEPLERTVNDNSSNMEMVEKNCRDKLSRMSFVKSDSDLNKNTQIEVIKSKSWSYLNPTRFSYLDCIFGDRERPLGNKVYCVGYFTVENNINKEREGSSEKVQSSSKESSVKVQSSEKSEEPKGKYKFRQCESECPSRKTDGSCAESVCSLNLPEGVPDSITVTKCMQETCNNRVVHKKFPEASDDRILVDLSSMKKSCCDSAINQKVEEMTGGMNAKLIFSEEACFCSCECTFGFTKKTTYCGVCGGYESAGEDFTKKPPNAPFPCPIYHKLVDKNKLKTWSTSGSESKRKGEDGQKAKTAASAKSGGDRNTEPEKDSKKGKKKKKDERFKFNYGYTAPQIGHSQCAMPCTGTLGAVPKNMGWLWTAEDVPGMKFRPMWKPGASNKHVVRLLRIAKNPGVIIAKKKRKDAGKKKRPLKRPLLIVHKKDGEYTVTMETMKTYSKPRALNQVPFEDKPVVTYTIGRTDEENRERRRKKERVQKRLEVEQRHFIQSAFRDMCKEICLKTYQQALGILPDAEDPECACYPKHPGEDKTNLELSCPCSVDSESFGSDTDSDEWIVEFTPPNATFDPTYKPKKVFKADNSTQYTYLDYKVKLVDRYGNPVPRFFKGPDGRTQCSDLGGFWSPDHKWLEINVEGYIGPDGRWAPMAFIGPSGEQVDCDTGKFQASNGNWLVVGVDGYVDSNGRWKFYPKPKRVAPQKKRHKLDSGKKGAGDKKDDQTALKPSEATWSCFGDASPKELSKAGIVGHGQDKKILLATLKEMLAHGEDVKIPQPSIVPRFPASKKSKKGKCRSPEAHYSSTYFMERMKCRHPVPSDKGIVAVDDRGNKTYFRLKDQKNRRPKERIANLTEQGISLSSFHVPCFHSFINSEISKKQLQDRLIAMSNMAGDKNTKSKCVSTQAGRT